MDVPPSYDATNRTPETLLVWLHGCYGQAADDVLHVSPNSDRHYITIAVNGPEDGSGGTGQFVCWNPPAEDALVLAAIANAKTHFNINPRRVIIAGYSSGGDLAYSTIFFNAKMFAGILAMNTNPFRDTGSSKAQLLAAAAWKFNAVQVAHDMDDTYHLDACNPCASGTSPDPGVRPAVDDMTAAGFPVQLVVRPGHHYDDDGFAGPSSGSYYDIEHSLLPHVDDGWLAPVQ